MSGAAVFRRQPRRAPIPPPEPGVRYAVAKGAGLRELTHATLMDREDAEAERDKFQRERGGTWRLVEVREVRT